MFISRCKSRVITIFAVKLAEPSQQFHCSPDQSAANKDLHCLPLDMVIERQKNTASDPKWIDFTVCGTDS